MMRGMLKTMRATWAAMRLVFSSRVSAKRASACSAPASRSRSSSMALPKRKGVEVAVAALEGGALLVDDDHLVLLGVEHADHLRAQPPVADADDVHPIP